MGFLQRIERKLEGAVDDGFARVFGGKVAPQEVENALQRETEDRLEDLGGGNLLAPNSFTIVVSDTDHDQLAAEYALNRKTFSKHLEHFIADNGWQTYGDVIVEIDQSSTLRTGQFRAIGQINPDVKPRPLGDDGQPRRREPPAPLQQIPYQQNAADPTVDPRRVQVPGPRPSTNLNSPGAPMTRNNGPDQRGYGNDRGGYDQGYSQQGGYDQGRPEQGGYDYGRPDYNRPEYGNPEYDRQYDQGGAYPQGGAPGYDPRSDQAGYDQQPAYDQHGYDYNQQGYQGNYDQGGYQQAGYDQRGYEQQPAYDQRGYQQPGYDDRGYDQRGYEQAPGYSQHDYQQGYDQPGYDQQQGYDPQRGYDQGGYGQQGYPQQGGYPGGGYDGGYPAAPAQSFAPSSIVLYLEDGSNRTFALRDGANVIGRGQDAQFRLPDTGVSRRHVEIRWDGQSALLNDLNSTNGTTVNDVQVTSWELADGDRIRVGHSDITVRFQ